MLLKVLPVGHTSCTYMYHGVRKYSNPYKGKALIYVQNTALDVIISHAVISLGLAFISSRTGSIAKRPLLEYHIGKLLSILFLRRIMADEITMIQAQRNSVFTGVFHLYRKVSKISSAVIHYHPQVDTCHFMPF